MFLVSPTWSIKHLSVHFISTLGD